jgi:hypothetical protein
VSVLAPDARERRTLAIGAAVVAVAYVLTAWLLPATSRWRDREAMIDALRRQRAQLVALADQRESLEQGWRAREAAAEALPVRLVRGRTPALAASALQEVLQEYATVSRIAVSRLDVASAPDSAGSVPTLPATVAATGDIYGLADFLSRVEHGRVLLQVTEVAVSPNPSLRGELLQLAVTVRAPFLLSP